MSGFVTIQRKATEHHLFSLNQRALRKIETIWGKAEGFIYFIAAGHDPEWVKIGFTAGDPRKRLKALQTGCPLKLVLLGAIPAPGRAEAELHDVLREERGIGEWFGFTPYVSSLIAHQLESGER